MGQRGSQNVPCISSAAVLTAGLNCLGQKGGISAPISLPWLLLARTSRLFLSSDSKTSLPKARTPSQICLTPKPAVHSLLLQTTTYRKPTDFLPAYRLACSGLCTLSLSSILNTPALSLPNSLKVHSKFQIGGLPWWFSG